MSLMSESATKIKRFFRSTCFFVPLLLHTAIADTLQATGAEDRPLLGSKLSADSGAKTRLGFGQPLNPGGELDSLGLASTRKIPGGLGDRVPRRTLLLCYRLVSSIPLLLRFRSFVASMSPPSTSA